MGIALSNALHSGTELDGQLSLTGSRAAELRADIFHPANERQSELWDFVERSGDIKAYVLSDVSGWISGLRAELHAKNPFAAEEAFIQNVQSANTTALSLEILAHIQDEYELLPSVHEDTRGDVAPPVIDFDFYRSELDAPQDRAALNNAAKTAASGKALFRHLKSDIQSEYAVRKTQWERERTEKSRGDFMHSLYKKIAAFQKLEPLVSPLVDDAARLWSLAASSFCETDFDVLQHYAQFLEQDVFIAQLADVLGRRGRKLGLSEKKICEQANVIPEYETARISGVSVKRGGIRLSGDIPNALPAEITLYTHKSTRKYFMLKFVQQQLLSYASKRSMPKNRRHILQCEEHVIDLEARGPVLICIDTSSSMQGEPERIAKTTAFALVKIAVSEKRSCYLISFSTGIEMLDVSCFEKGEAVLQLVRFLNGSFNGGTDATPALTHAVEQLQSRQWQYADVLVISDFIMPSIPPVLEEKIKTEQKKETGFYGLAVGENCSCNSRILRLFDAHWNYNPRRPAPQAELIKQLSELKARKIE